MQASTFETYMLTDDSIRHPMTFQSRFVFKGEADTSLLRKAFDEVTPLHPMLTATAIQQGGTWTWTHQNRSIPLDCGPLGKKLTCNEQVAIDLNHEAGMRFWCRSGDGQTELTMQGHHACTDGLGALQFVFDVLARYHLLVNEIDLSAANAMQPNGQTSSRREWCRTIDTELLLERDQADFTPPEPVGFIKQVRCTVVETAKLLLRQPQRFRSPHSSAVANAEITSCDLPQLHAIELSAETSEAYRRAARTQGVMANDMLIRDMFVTLAKWSERCGHPLPDRSWLRLTMPINLRKRAHAKMSAANAISYAFLTRRVESTRDPARLLASIHEETEAIKYWRIGSMFLGAIAAMQRARVLQPVLGLPTCFSSLVLSNVGDIRHCATARFPRNGNHIVAGNLELQTVGSAPPPRSKTHGAVVVSRYAGRFSLGIQTDDTIDSAAAKEFLNLYAAQITASVA